MLDACSTSLLVNGGADLGFRNQHQFDVLKAVDTSKKDLAAKRWMSCLVVSNGFRFEESTVQLSQEDRETLERERNFFKTRVVPASNPPFFVPDHLAPRCHRCKVLFSVSLRRYHCRSCGLVLCGNCFTWRGTHLVALDERSHVRNSASSCIRNQGPGGGRTGAQFVEQQEVVGNLAHTAAANRSDATGADPDASNPSGEASGSSRRTGPTTEAHAATSSPQPAHEDSFEEPPLAEELPAVGLPMSVVCLSSAMASDGSGVQRGGHRRSQGIGGDSSESGISQGGTRMIRLCASCSTFFEAGVGETYSSLLQRKGF